MASLYVIPVAAALLTMGLVGLLRPTRILATFGVEVRSPDGRNEVRAVYGGYGVFSAALLAWALTRPDLQAGIFIAMAASMLGMAAGRLIGVAVERPRAGSPVWVFFVVEVALGALLVGASRG